MGKWKQIQNPKNKIMKNWQNENIKKWRNEKSNCPGVGSAVVEHALGRSAGFRLSHSGRRCAVPTPWVDGGRSPAGRAPAWGRTGSQPPPPAVKREGMALSPRGGSRTHGVLRWVIDLSQDWFVAVCDRGPLVARGVSRRVLVSTFWIRRNGKMK